MADAVDAGAGTAVCVIRRANVAHRTAVAGVSGRVDGLAGRRGAEKAEETAAGRERVAGVAARDLASATTAAGDAVRDRADVADRTAAWAREVASGPESERNERQERRTSF